MKSERRLLTVASRLYRIIVGFVVVLAFTGIISFETLSRLKVNGPVYEGIVHQKDLLADILPPPLYVLETYLIALQMVGESEPAVLKEDILKIQALKKEFVARTEFWTKELDDSPVRRVIIEDSHRPAVAFFDTLEREFIPAIQRQDRATATAVAYGNLRSKYLEHRKAIDHAVKLATQNGQLFETEAAKEIRNRMVILVGALVGGLVLIGLYGWRAARSLIQENEEHRKTELALTESEGRYRQLVELSPNAVFIQCGGKFAFINWSGAKMLGADDPNQIIGKTVLEYVHPNYRDAIAERIKQVNAGKPLPLYEYKFVLPDESTVDVEVAAMPFNYRGQPAAQVIARNITESKQAEAKLRASEALYLSLVENLPQNVLRKDTSGRFTFANQRFCQLLGKSPNDIIGKTDFDFFPEELAQQYREDDKRVMESNKNSDIVEGYVNFTGENKHMQVVKVPLHDAHQQVIGVQIVFWDVTDRKNAEIERERLIGELKSALAEVKTLTGIVPICAGCKQIRDDKGYWNQVEAYVEKHSLAKFSHGLCPDCAIKYFPNVKI